MSYSNPQYFNDKLVYLRSSDAKNISIPTTHGTNQTGSFSLYWPSINPLNYSNVQDNFRLSLDIKVEGTATAVDQEYYFIKNIMHASRVSVNYGGVVNFNSIGWQLMPILECYSDEYKASSNLLVNDDYVYDSLSDTTNFEYNEANRGVKVKHTGTPGAFSFMAHINTFIPNELFLQAIPGRPMNMTITFDNTLYSVLVSGSTGTTAKITKATLTFNEWRGGSKDMSVGLPRFTYFSVDAQNGAGTHTISSETNSENGCPMYVFSCLAQQGSLMSGSTVNLLQKPMPLDTADITVNNLSSAWNANDKYIMFGRMKCAGYKHTLSDALTNKAKNSTGFVICVDMTKITGCNISSDDIFRYSSNITYTGDATHQNVYLSTVYAYPSILHVSETDIEWKFTTSEEIGDGDYTPIEYMVVGGGFWDKIKSFGKKIISSAPSLIDKATRIASVVAPDSKAIGALNKANDISQILASSTSIF